MKRHTDDLVMTRQQFKEAPAFTLLNLEKPIRIRYSGVDKWVVLETEKYEALLTKIEELATK